MTFELIADLFFIAVMVLFTRLAWSTTIEGSRARGFWTVWKWGVYGVAMVALSLSVFTGATS